LAVIEAGERLARANGLTATVLRGLNNRLSSQWLIDPRKCVDDAGEGLALARRIGSRVWVFTLLEKVGQALWLTGEWDAALEAAAGGRAEDAALDLSAIDAAIEDRLQRLGALDRRPLGEVPPIALPRRP
jgi:hypothetical protein